MYHSVITRIYCRKRHIPLGGDDVVLVMTSCPTTRTRHE
jgi:hypothetical protein